MVNKKNQEISDWLSKKCADNSPLSITPANLTRAISLTHEEWKNNVEKFGSREDTLSMDSHEYGMFYSDQILKIAAFNLLFENQQDKDGQ